MSDDVVKDAKTPVVNWLHPEIMLLGDHTLSRLSWTLERETERIVALATEDQKLASLLAGNGWSPRMIAWGHLLAGFLDQLGFDDENGRT